MLCSVSIVFFRRTIMLLLAATCAACGTTPKSSSVGAPDRDLTDISDTYWSYAAMAADIYATRGVAEHLLMLRESSTLLKNNKPILVAPTEDDDIEQFLKPGRPGKTSSDIGFEEICPYTKPDKIQNIDPRCEIILPELAQEYLKVKDDKVKEAAFKAQQQKAKDLTNSLDAVPDSLDECTITDTNTRPKVPLVRLRDKPLSWQRLVELDKYESSEPWKLFIPELAIDVWRRERHDRGHKAYEYALIYRGTAGPGGWFSNLQFLTTMTPMVWDQYRQAIASTKKILRQIYYIHIIDDRRNNKSTELLFTAVGHSLGAGLAEYSYYRIPQITKVIGFNPTPIDGSHGLISLKERASIIESKKANPIDREQWTRKLPGKLRDSNMFFLTEKGEILSRLKSCTSGPIWGDADAPSAFCETVDLSSGNWFKQHDMRQLACKLAALHFNRPSTAAAPTASAE